MIIGGIVLRSIVSKISPQSLKALRRAAMLAIVPLVVALPAFAGGSNVSPLAPTPPTPSPVTPSATQVTSGATCAQQLDDHGVSLDQTSVDIAIAATSADAAGLIAEGLGEAGQPFTNPATVAGVAVATLALTPA